MFYVMQSEARLWTVGQGEGRDWNPVSDFPRQDLALQEAERLNNPEAYRLVDKMQRQIEELTTRISALEDEVAELSSQSNLAEMVKRYS